MIWKLVQAAAIGALTYGMGQDPKMANQIGTILVINIILVAFLTAVTVNLWDWLRRPRAAAGGPQVSQPQRQGGGAGAPGWFLGELPQKRL